MYHASGDNLVFGAILKQDGSFVIEGLTEGIYTLKVMFVGFKTYESKVFTITKETPRIKLNNIVLKQLKTKIGEVEVVSKRKPVVYKLVKK